MGNAFVLITFGWKMGCQSGTERSISDWGRQDNVEDRIRNFSEVLGWDVFTLLKDTLGS